GACGARGEDHHREAQDGGRDRRGTRPGWPDRVKDRGTHRSTPYVMDEKECHRESFGAACSVTLASRIIRTTGFAACDVRTGDALATTVALGVCAAFFGLEVATRVPVVPDNISLVLRPATRSVSPSSGLRSTRCSLPSWRPSATFSAPVGSTRIVTACTVIGLLSCWVVFCPEARTSVFCRIVLVTAWLSPPRLSTVQSTSTRSPGSTNPLTPET